MRSLISRGALCSLALLVTIGSATAAPDAQTPRVIKPRIVWDPIPFGPERKAQMVAYVRRHHGSFMKPT